MFLNENDMVECPYNSSHRMLRKRLQSHLLKCRKQYADVELRKCPFNITHLIPEPEFTHHATHCPDRKLLTQYKYDAPEQKEDEIPKHEKIECDENWDDTDVNDYNPRINLGKSKTLLKPDRKSRSERKLFIKNERKRLGDEESSDDEDKRELISEGKRQRDNYYRDNCSPVHYGQESRYNYTRHNRSISPNSSLYLRQRSRSPTIDPTRDRSRSPTSLRRSHGDYFPPTYSPPSYSRYNFAPSSAYSHYHPSYHLPAPVQHYDNDRRIANDQYYRGQDANYSNKNPAYYDHISEMPQAPPPPVISYSTPPSSMSKYL